MYNAKDLLLAVSLGASATVFYANLFRKDPHAETAGMLRAIWLVLAGWTLRYLLYGIK